MSEQASLSPRQRILEAVVTCIEKDGFNNLTTRKIAEQAGTNIASINYYFRSKDLLVSEALAMTLRHMMEDVVALIETPGRPFLEILEEVFGYLIDGGLRFPGTIMAHLYPVLVEKRMDTPVVHDFHKVFERLVSGAAQEYPATPTDELRMALAQVLSSAIFTMLSPGFFWLVSPLDLSQPEAPRRLAGYLTQAFAQSLAIGW
jgi:AcrR family transcriptional regulator